jgi:Na+/phosphate symporter
METEIIKLALSQGLWAALFVGLFFYVLRENSKREQNYQAIIQGLSEKFGSIEKGIEEIKAELRRR